MDYEYEQDEYGPRVLWGRLAFFAIALLLVFFVGRCTAGGGSEQDLSEARATASELATQNKQLQNELAAVQATQDQANNGPAEQPSEAAEPAGEASEAPTEGEQDSVAEGGETYTVESGDTLVTIANRFYGDSQKYRLIVDANNLDPDAPLTVGQKLTIPPEE